MKTQIKKVAFVAAITMVCGICFLNSQKSETMSEITLANVEALANKTPTGNTGPGEIIVCSGGNGSRKECMCRNEYECTPSPCQ